MSTTDKKVTMTVKSVKAVGAWSWDLNVDNCAICRNHIMDLCIECQAATPSNTAPSATASTKLDCPVAWGACNHAFHRHCIQKWLQTRKVCPLDNKAWSYQELKH